MKAKLKIQIKRIYEEKASSDGVRILVDRLWPRGVSKEKAALDDWFKDVAPSSELRIWFDHQPARMEEFSKRYVQELENDPQKQMLVKQIRELAEKRPVTLLYGAKDPQINHAIVLRDYLLEQ